MTLILPWVGLTPMAIEIALHNLHLLNGCLLGIFLKACVDGCVYLQTAGIEVVTILFAPFLEIV